ncbi:uncharacterized protein [Coffea arabica]|uniref:HMA domain-containing protein n=1 Tax=Coffea arabica TaxID=13443 RepID=A0ABM4U8J8_COFAR|nr:heavy metal-associated isoprenylated plant protein 7 [Coffea arabica]
MGEEEKKPEEKKPEEAKVVEGDKKDEAPKGDEKKAAAEESKDKDSPPAAAAPVPPPPQEIILQVYMHCEGCARKVRRCLKGFDGVEEVVTDCKASKVVVKGDKADPLKVLERVQRKSHRQVQLLSPIPKPRPPEEAKKVEEKEVPKPEEKKEELPVITVVLKVHMHCEACAQKMKRRIQKMQGVESVQPDLNSSEVTVKGAFEPPKLVDLIYKGTDKHAEIVKVEPEKKEEEKPKEGKEEAKADGGGEKGSKKGEDDGKKPEKEDGAPPLAGGSVGEDQPPKQEAGQEGGDPKLEMKKNDFYYYHPQNHHQNDFYYYHPQNNQQLHHPAYVQESYGYPAYPPQMFSDENPHACSVM